MAAQSLNTFNPYAHQWSKSCLFNQAHQTWKRAKNTCTSVIRRQQQEELEVILDSEKSAVFILMSLAKDGTVALEQRGILERRRRRRKWSFSRGAGRGGGINEMQISPHFFSNGDSWSVALTGDTVSPTSPNKHFSVFAAQTNGFPNVPRRGTFSWLAAGDLMSFAKMRIMCHEEILPMHACWTGVFVHLVRQYPQCHFFPRAHTKPKPWLNHWINQVLWVMHVGKFNLPHNGESLLLR